MPCTSHFGSMFTIVRERPKAARFHVEGQNENAFWDRYTANVYPVNSLSLSVCMPSPPPPHESSIHPMHGSRHVPSILTFLLFVLSSMAKTNTSKRDTQKREKREQRDVQYKTSIQYRAFLHCIVSHNYVIISLCIISLHDYQLQEIK